MKEHLQMASAKLATTQEWVRNLELMVATSVDGKNR